MLWTGGVGMRLGNLAYGLLARKTTVGGAISGLLLFFLVACGEGSARPATGSGWNASTIDQPTGLSSGPGTGLPAPSRDAAETTAAQPVPVMPPRPQGKIPKPLIGAWSGGEGGKSGYRLTFFVDSTYELVHERVTAVPAFREVGYCVGGGTSFLLLRPVRVEGPVTRRERMASWSIQPSSVVDVLTVIDQVDGEFSYVRIG
jgi:hypothetical protein